MTVITASNTVQYSNDTSIELSGISYPPAKLKEITVTDSYTGSWRIIYDYACCGDSGAGSECYNTPVYFGLYKNGAPYGAFFQTSTCDWANQSEDFTGINIVNGDKVQIYGYVSDIYADVTLSLRNFRIEFTPSISTGNASFTSNPTNAQIWIDGSNTGLTTPNTITNLSATTHSYTLKLTGYADATGSFSVTAGSTTTVPTVTFAPSLYITSVPPGASIYIDGILQGVTSPAIITNLSVGSHTYRLVLAGYNVSSGNFTTTAGQTTNISSILSGTAMAFLAAGD